MDEILREQLEQLERATTELRKAATVALGFTASVQYQGINFNIGRRFVIAEMDPLAFFHLVEHIQEGDLYKAVTRLYERLEPLLLCHHQWTPLKREDDERVLGMGMRDADGVSRVKICRSCTAYALGEDLPEIGRGDDRANAG